VRWIPSALIAAAVLALPAAAASVDPRVLVLRELDVPPRYLFDKDNSAVLSPALLARTAEARRLVVRSGFVTGYTARYLNSGPPRWRYVKSAAYVFRGAEGAKIYQARLEKSFREQGAVRRGPVDLGDGGLRYFWRAPDVGTHVLWRSGRVVAYVGCEQMTGHRTLALALAQKQQRRIAAALR
jgi:hypothetical protein